MIYSRIIYFIFLAFCLLNNAFAQAQKDEVNLTEQALSMS